MFTLRIAGRLQVPCSISNAQMLASSCNFFDLPAIKLPFSPSIQAFRFKATTGASYAPPNPPEPLLTSILCGRYRQHCCRQILTSREESLA